MVTAEPVCHMNRRENKPAAKRFVDIFVAPKNGQQLVLGKVICPLRW